MIGIGISIAILNVGSNIMQQLILIAVSIPVLLNVRAHISIASLVLSLV